jgi:hypothetical protein
LRNGGRHTLRIQSPHYVCTRGPCCAVTQPRSEAE